MAAIDLVHQCAALDFFKYFKFLNVEAKEIF